MNDEERLWLWLNYATEHNPRLFYAILQRFDDLDEAFAAARQKEWDAFGEIGDNVKKRLLAARASA